jgi:type II secretory pathway predicted ATPase ExeA
VQNLSSSFLLKNIKIKIWRNIILPVLLYGRETWFLRLREHKLRVFENRILINIFGPRMDEVTEEWRRLYKEEIYGLFSPNIIQ